MRKLLINSTALATVAGLTAGVAFADVSITATNEFAFQSRDSKVAASNGDFNSNAAEVTFNFSNKTDNGITVAYNTQLTSNGTVGIDESYMTISGGFGKVVLGEKDGAGGTYGIEAGDLIAEESAAGSTASSTILTDSDIGLGVNDNVKVSYHLPAIGNLTVGVSFEDSAASATANTATDISSIGARYSMDLGGMAVTLGGASAVQETTAGTVDNEATNVGVKIVKGKLSAIISSATYKADDEDITASGYSVSYDMGDGLTVGAYRDSSKDALDLGEKFTISGIEAQYNIAAGLTAVLGMDSYDYNNGTEASVVDDGSLTKLTIKAAF